jgi:hypothetical protein
MNGLKIANNKHDMVALRLFDPSEKELPNLGLIKMYDAEKNTVKWVNSSSRIVRNKYKNKYERFEQELNDEFRKAGVDFATLATNGKYLSALNQLFLSRA